MRICVKITEDIEREASLWMAGGLGPALLGCFQAKPSLSRGESLGPSAARSSSPHPERSTRHAVDTEIFHSLLLIQIILGAVPTRCACKAFRRPRSLIFVASPCMFLKFLECTQGGKLLRQRHYKYPNKYIHTNIWNPD